MQDPTIDPMTAAPWGTAKLESPAAKRVPLTPGAAALLIASMAGSLALGPTIAWAEPYDATLVADRDCPGTLSTRRPDNPGQVRLEPGRIYRVIARNKAEATHWLLRIEGVQPKDRWVEVGCGHILQPDAARTQPPLTSGAKSKPIQMLLAASWLPAFCETRGSAPECRSQSPDSPDARRFSLHGLWPQPMGNDFCGVSPRDRTIAESGNWDRLPPPRIDERTRRDLALRMPGVASHLERYEWQKHGTCYGTDADAYFDQAMALLDQLNGSPVQALFAERAGQRVRATEVREVFDRSFGPGSGDRIQMVCDREGRVLELRIALKGPVDGASRLSALILAAPTRGPGCRGGWVDRAGPGH